MRRKRQWRVRLDRRDAKSNIIYNMTSNTNGDGGITIQFNSDFNQIGKCTAFGEMAPRTSSTVIPGPTTVLTICGSQTRRAR